MSCAPERRRIFPESSTLENLKIGSYLVGSRETQEDLEYVLNFSFRGSRTI